MGKLAAIPKSQVHTRRTLKKSSDDVLSPAFGLAHSDFPMGEGEPRQPPPPIDTLQMKLADLPSYGFSLSPRAPLGALEEASGL